MNYKQYYISTLQDSKQPLSIKDIQNIEQVKTSIPDNLMIFNSTIKFEQTREGPKPEVRVYDTNDDRCLERAKNLYLKALAVCEGIKESGK